MRWFRRRKPIPERYAPAPPQWDVSIFRRPASSPRWDHVPMTGPYRTIRCDDDDAAEVRYARVDSELSEAISQFARINFPRVGEVCLLVDGDDIAILAWWDTHRGGPDLRFRWVGCKFAFDLLAVAEPVNAALWERLAYQEMFRCEPSNQPSPTSSPTTSEPARGRPERN